MKELSSVSNPIVKAAAELNAIGGGSCKLWYSETAFCA